MIKNDNSGRGRATGPAAPGEPEPDTDGWAWSVLPGSRRRTVTSGPLPAGVPLCLGGWWPCRG
eukprot:755904-Hanusia_phi.AAC.1